MNMKKAQAAMEFLYTYGWAILLVLISIAALSYFGVLSPDNFLPEKCAMPSGITCLDFSATQNTINIILMNTAGFNMKDVTLRINDIECQGVTYFDDDQKETFTCKSNYSVGKNKFVLGINYTNTETSLDHQKHGELIVKIPAYK